MSARYRKVCVYCHKKYETDIEHQKFCSCICIEKAKIAKRKYKLLHQDKIKAYYQANKKQTRERARIYCLAHSEKAKIRLRAYYQTYSEKIKARNRTYRLVNLDKIKIKNKTIYSERIRACNRKYRALKLNVSHEPYVGSYIFERDNWTCQLCGQKINKRLKWPHPRSKSLDHIIPLSKGGDDNLANVQAAHLRCNIGKHATNKGQLRLFG